MRVDLHNHTTLCNHATGTMREYIHKAIELGIDIYGFSDHAPMPYDQKYRMDLFSMNSYEESIEELQKEYIGQIEILKAYEVDFMQDRTLILDEVINSKVDYLIGSVHFLQGKNSSLWGFDNPEFIGKYKEKDIDTIWVEYFSAIEELAKSKLFDIVGHLDLIKVFKYLPKKDIKLLALDALKEIKRADMVIEINSAGLRKPIGETYPSKELLEVIFELDIPITFSSDAHSVEQIGFMYEDVCNLAKDIGFTKCATFKNRDRKLVNF